MDKVRYEIGVCPQHCILWGELTVVEHFLFYARLKGVPRKNERDHVNQWLSQLGLGFAKDLQVSKLSGGMKRRVSVGIALVGYPAVVFLDEPTAGLDPENKRNLWQIIERIRSHTAMVLTTHSMTEAEALSTRIGIMAKGTMRAIGAPQHLKSSVGNLFSLKINFAPENALVVESFVLHNFPSAQKIHGHHATLEFHIPVASNQVLEVLSVMARETKEKAISVISEWSFCEVGLDEVFRRIVAASNQ
eukprot:Phypoly_transcript_16969.p1 GENE.Phypoly_transcript_16969~~Phypoly_transcript_16969.p1  ORF type:complete len:273 (+),score=30.54 Phypoly_transcript_16969:80-820(+)